MSTTVIITWIHFRDIANVILDWAWLWIRKRMADAEVRRCLDWLEERKGEFERASFGGSSRNVVESSNQHYASRQKLLEYRKQMDKLAAKQTLTDAELHSMYGAYHSLETMVDKKSGCLEMVKGIATMEDLIQGLSTEFDFRTVHLVNVAQNNKQKNGDSLSNETLAKAAQSCISAVRQSWRWLDEVMQCAHVHLANASAYHQFFHDVEETDYFMKSTLANMHTTFRRQNVTGARADIMDMNKEIQDTLFAYLRWQSKVDNLVTRSRDVVPVHKRTLPCKEPQLCIALANYKTGELEFEEGETLTLVDNTDKAKWKVKNGRDQTGIVPAVILLLNGPTGEAIDAAVRLRLQLLGLWTTSVKRLGYQMIAFMLSVFRDWSDDEVTAIQQMPKQKRDELLRVLKLVEETLEKNWQGYDGFDELQEKIARLRTILEEADTVGSKGKQTEPCHAVVQVNMLETLLSGYQDFWSYWETYKMSAELAQQPKYILVCDKWDQLRYTSSAHYVRFWDTNLRMPQDGGKQYKAEAALTIHETPKSKMESESSSSEDILIKAQTTSRAESAPVSEEMNKANQKREVAFPDDFIETQIIPKSGYDEEDGEWESSTDITEMKQRRETTMDEVQSSMEEVETTFVIKKVFHPQTNDPMSLQDAVLAGIIDQAEGMFVDIKTGKRYTFQEAIANGDIMVDFKAKRTVKKEKSSYGLVTIKTIKENRPYSIKCVIEPKTDKELTVEEAEKRGIVNLDEGTYRAESGDTFSMVDAIQSGLVKATFHGKPEDTSEETKTYAVNGVVDQRRKESIPFNDAMRRGLFDSDDGMYVNNVTKERIPFTDAVIKGFIKARVITDTSKLDIDPSNAVVVQRLTSAQQKIIKQVRVTRAFKSSSRNVNGN